MWVNEWSSLNQISLCASPAAEGLHLPRSAEGLVPGISCHLGRRRPLSGPCLSGLTRSGSTADDPRVPLGQTSALTANLGSLEEAGEAEGWRCSFDLPRTLHDARDPRPPAAHVAAGGFSPRLTPVLRALRDCPAAWLHPTECARGGPPTATRPWHPGSDGVPGLNLIGLLSGIAPPCPSRASDSAALGSSSAGIRRAGSEPHHAVPHCSVRDVVAWRAEKPAERLLRRQTGDRCSGAPRGTLMIRSPGVTTAGLRGDGTGSREEPT
jgi:hypothetical protein